MASVHDSGFKGISHRLRSFAGVEALHVQHPGQRCIAEHAHDWPNLTIPLLGAASERYEDATIRLSGPAAVYHPAGSAHASNIEGTGLETLGILFDPAWIRLEGARPDLDRALGWQGGAGGAMARQVARLWMRADVSERTLRHAMLRLLAAPRQAPASPEWLPIVQRAIAAGGVASTTELARRVGLHPAWLARAYRAATAQGLQESLRLGRVESAVRELRTTCRPLVDVALAAGFCDQAHMHRSVASVLGKTPGQIRAQALAGRNRYFD